MSDYDLFDTAVSPQPKALVVEEAHEQLKQNLGVALKRHREIMDMPMDTAGDKRLVLEAANMTVKAALTTDRTALKARQENALERVFLRVLFHAKRLGQPLSEDDERRFRAASRSEIEAALGEGPGVPRLMAEYDRMEK